MYIVSIQSNIRIPHQKDEVSVNIHTYTPEEWVNVAPKKSPTFNIRIPKSKTNHDHTCFEFDLQKELKTKGIDEVLYVNIPPQNMYKHANSFKRWGKEGEKVEKELCIRGTEPYRIIVMLDDSRWEYEKCYDIINSLNPEVLISMVNRNQIPRFINNCNIDPTKILFVPRSYAISHKNWQNPMNNWDQKLPAIAFSMNINGERATFAEKLSSSLLPFTIMNYHPITLFTSSYASECKMHLRQEVKRKFLEMYGTHLIGVNLPRGLPTETTNHYDVGHFVYRILEITGSQCALFQRQIPQESGFYLFFEPGVNCVEWTDFDDFKEKADYYLKHKEETLNIARKGYEVANGVCSTENTRKVIHDLMINNITPPSWTQYP